MANASRTMAVAPYVLSTCTRLSTVIGTSDRTALLRSPLCIASLSSSDAEPEYCAMRSVSSGSCVAMRTTTRRTTTANAMRTPHGGQHDR
jgi:hypothetical protein